MERAESEWMVVRDRDPVVRRLGGSQDDLTAGLVDHRALPSPAQDARETRSGDLTRNLHATSRVSSRTR